MTAPRRLPWPTETGWLCRALDLARVVLGCARYAATSVREMAELDAALKPLRPAMREALRDMERRAVERALARPAPPTD